MSKLFKRLQKQRQEKELEEMNVKLEEDHGEEEEPQPQARNLFGAFAMGDSSDEDSFEKGEHWAEPNI